MTPGMCIRARVVWPVNAPAIDDGVVVVRGGLITEVGPASMLSAPPGTPRIDLGDVILMPGLVNAHCHLDYTHLALQVAPEASFTDWIKSITTVKGTSTLEDFRAGWLAGAGMLLRRGVTTVADVEAVPSLLPDVWSGTPLRVISFLEMTGVRSRRDPAAILDEAMACLNALPRGRCSVGLSPHAPYSTVPELLRLSAAVAADRGWPVTIHVAESAEEDEMFAGGRGAMYDWLARNGRDMRDCGDTTPVQHLARCGILGPGLLAVHANYLRPGDVEVLAQSGTSVVHCPRSHAYFGHRPFPHTALVRAGVNVCLGTDSLTTVLRREDQTLDLLAELRTFLAHAPGVPAEEAVRMATVCAARALGLAGRAGCLAPGFWADAIALPYAGVIEGVPEAVVAHRGDVAASLVDGSWVLGPAGRSAVACAG